APDSQQESSPLSGRKSTQATVRICGASSLSLQVARRTIIPNEEDVLVPERPIRISRLCPTHNVADVTDTIVGAETGVLAQTAIRLLADQRVETQISKG
ncbi:hypothetical protein, partial [Bradyrhizobium liaoningense]